METPIEGRRSKHTRRNALRLITAGAAASLIDAGWIEPGLLSITRQDRVCKQLPPALDGLRIGLLADFHFRPERGIRAFMDDWLSLGGPHHFVTNLGDHADRWRRLAELLELDYVEI